MTIYYILVAFIGLFFMFGRHSGNDWAILIFRLMGLFIFSISIYKLFQLYNLQQYF